MKSKVIGLFLIVGISVFLGGCNRDGNVRSAAKPVPIGQVPTPVVKPLPTTQKKAKGDLFKHGK